MIADQIADEAAMYVLGLLPADEARRFEAEIAANPELAELVGRLETGAAAIAWTAPAVEPPPELRGRIADRIKRDGEELERRVAPFPSWVARGVPWAIAACCALTTGAFVYRRYEHRLEMADFILRDRHLSEELDKVQARDLTLIRKNLDLQLLLVKEQGEVAELKARNVLAGIKIEMLASMAKNAPQAAAVVAWDPGAQRGIVKAVNMPAAGADRDYQLWIIDPDYKTPVSAGVFDPGQGANFEPAHPISKADKFAVSLEPKGGSESPRGPIVMVSE